MFVELDLQSDIPIYTQLVEQLMREMARGQLRPGDPLPSVRSLAADLGINMHTVNKAYQILKQDGFLQAHRKQGVVIATGAMPGVTAAFREKLSRQLGSLAAEAAMRGMTEEAFSDYCRAEYRKATKNGGEEA